MKPAQSPPIRRPVAIRIDPRRCVHCGLCVDLVGEPLDAPDRIPVSSAALDAMAACPSGAIVWCDDEEIAVRASR
jgi:ferredoxin